MNIENEYLAFSIGNEEYGINILGVQEIRQFEAVTRIAYAAPHELGVLNLRGTIVPIADMRSLLLHKKHEVTASTVTVFCTCSGVLRGIVVDSVNDVIRPMVEEVKSTGLMSNGAFKMINAIASMPNNRHVLLTTVEQLLGIESQAAKVTEPELA